MDLTSSLFEQPDIIRGLTDLTMQPYSFGLAMTIGFICGGVAAAAGSNELLNGKWFSLNPATLLGTLLLATSLIAPVPIILGLGCFGVWYAAKMGASSASIAVSILARGPNYRHRQGPSRERYRLADLTPFVLISTLTFRRRAWISGAIIGAAGFSMLFLDNGLGVIFVLWALVAWSFSLPYVRRIVWKRIRKDYQRWGGIWIAHRIDPLAWKGRRWTCRP